VLKGVKRLEDIDEDAIRAKLYTAPWSDPDLLIRTSGECRSPIPVWQLAYTELYITPSSARRHARDCSRRSSTTKGGAEVRRITA